MIAACGGGGTTAPPASTTAPKTDAQSAPATTSKTQMTTTGQAASTPGTGKATGEPVKVGILCDRSGSQAGPQGFLCDGVENWIEYVTNAEGGINGRPMEFQEVDVKYEVPLAVDAYKKMTSRDNIQHFIPFGTPLIDALAPASAEDKAVIWSPGFGLSDAADGNKYPYIFPGVATYHSQAMAVMQYISGEWKTQGKTGNPKVLYLYWDNPAGQDPLNLIRDKAAGLNLDLVDTVAVPATTVDMTTIMTQVKDKNPDYVMAHVFAKQPVLMIQAAEKIGFPVNKIVGFVWALDEDVVKVVGNAGEGFRGLHFTSHFSDEPEAYKKLEGWWQSSGRTPNPRARGSVFYSRGMAIGNFMVEAARLAD
ncbi:MAG TPA: ABC transporter substrate-binding protein, partial [Dehalococcoidia bacterium]|nr:ABC transporter substrate-binding protein [Dehalococcoidia bacterium]